MTFSGILALYRLKICQGEGHMKYVMRLFQFKGYDARDVSISLRDNTVTIDLKTKTNKKFTCYRCRSPLGRLRGQHRLRIKELSVMGMRCFVSFWRRKGDCPTCKKARSEHVGFLAKESPHMSQRYAWWIGKMCEIAAEARVAELVQENKMTVMRVDIARLKRMLKHYKIPPVEWISVDEVYARSKGKPGESRDKRFFTIISDLKTRRVIWVSESRSKAALDQFYSLIGREACQNIRIVAMDQHDAYKVSTEENCPNALIVWDRFHLMQSFNNAANDLRSEIFQYSNKSDPIRQLTRPKSKFIFLKKDSRRTKEERQHLDEAIKQNELLLKLEMIKERVHSFFQENDPDIAWKVWDEIGDWIDELGFKSLISWFKALDRNWDTLQNYFKVKVSSALSEGQNNVIKTLKRRAFGYRNMEHFRLKILQVCGYLNSRYIKDPSDLVSLA